MTWPGLAMAVQTATGQMHCTCGVGWHASAGPTCWCCGADGLLGELPRGTRSVPFADNTAPGVMGEL